MDPFNAEPFTIVDGQTTPAASKDTSDHFGKHVGDDYKQAFSGISFNTDIKIRQSLKAHYPNHTITVVPLSYINLLAFAYDGNAKAVLDTDTDEAIAYRGYYRGFRGGAGGLGSAYSFAKYVYTWLTEDFILYNVQVGYYTFQYILHEVAKDEKVTGNSKITDALITAIGEWSIPDEKYVYVFDGYWMASRSLYDEVQKATWKDVILDEKMKKALSDIVGKFYDSKDVYDDLGVPWKRGVIFYGPAGNGKTISIKAIMNNLANRKVPIPLLYVKSANTTYAIRSVFATARAFAPCLLILEDIDTIVTPYTRSYFFNEADGLERNDGIMMIASTNHLDQLDPGLSKRPSRFDRKYLFPLPSLAERNLYCQYWRQKLASKPSIKFPKRLCNPMATLMYDFSFAYMKEAFVSTLLVIAGNRSEKSLTSGGNDPQYENSFTITGAENGGGDNGNGDDDLDDFELWREIKKQVLILREDMDSSKAATGENQQKRLSDAPEPQFDDLDVTLDAKGRAMIVDHPRRGQVEQPLALRHRSRKEEVWGKFVPDNRAEGGMSPWW